MAELMRGRDNILWVGVAKRLRGDETIMSEFEWRSDRNGRVEEVIRKDKANFTGCEDAASRLQYGRVEVGDRYLRSQNHVRKSNSRFRQALREHMTTPRVRSSERHLAQSSATVSERKVKEKRAPSR